MTLGNSSLREQLCPAWWENLHLTEVSWRSCKEGQLLPAVFRARLGDQEARGSPLGPDGSGLLLSGLAPGVASDWHLAFPSGALQARKLLCNQELEISPAQEHHQIQGLQVLQGCGPEVG